MNNIDTPEQGNEDKAARDRASRRQSHWKRKLLVSVRLQNKSQANLRDFKKLVRAMVTAVCGKGLPWADLGETEGARDEGFALAWALPPGEPAKALAVATALERALEALASGPWARGAKVSVAVSGGRRDRIRWTHCRSYR